MPGQLGQARTATWRIDPRSFATSFHRPLCSGSGRCYTLEVPSALLAASRLRTSSTRSGRLRLRSSLFALGAVAGTTAILGWNQFSRSLHLESPEKAAERSVVRLDGKPTMQRIISAEELGKHSDGTSLWVAIDGDVWDVTDFYMRHPGGPQFLVDRGGQDVTQIFQRTHAQGVLEKTLSHDLLIGRLEEKNTLALSEVKDESTQIKMAREALFGVDSMVNLDDFEVSLSERLDGCETDMSTEVRQGPVS